MNNFHATVESIFHAILKFKKFEILEKKENSILFFNENCYLFVGHHMGEVFVNLRNDRKQIIQPLMWAIINNKIDYNDILPLIYSPNEKMENIVKYNLLTEKNLISLYCKELLDGDFSKYETYIQKFEKKNEELYNFFDREYYSN